MTDHQDQAELIHSTDWEYLLILDACRYDAFNNSYRVHLPNNEPQPVWSPGSNTVEWLAETWPDEYPDITYVSAHPTVNSEGYVAGQKARKQLIENDAPGADYVPAEHFPNIVDVWDWGYVERLETVHPEAVNAVLFDTDPPAIGHYTQPHFPFVRGVEWAEANNFVINSRPRTKLTPGPERSLGPRFSRQNIKDVFGINMVRHAYYDNLDFVLKHVGDVLDELAGTVVITADHGEFLEGNEAHPGGQDDSELREVPWYVLEADA